ncbi:MAG: DNA-binding protein, partial [Betaproteobacteria bacterium]|nr:DNA-binding protein [Betaproteobacteria bacterium]
MTESNYLTQTQLADRWQVAESTLERWRSEGIGPLYMKMMGRVRYRLSDI